MLRNYCLALSQPSIDCVNLKGLPKSSIYLFHVTEAAMVACGDAFSDQANC